MADHGTVIGKVLKGQDVQGLLRYLYGPGRANEHSDPHLVAVWDEPAADLEPSVAANGRCDLRSLTNLLEQPLEASIRRPAQPVWHCALRVAPGDRRLSDDEWAEVARQVVHRTGFARADDDGGCRWVAVRHADDHIHLVVTLGRQDGARVSTSNDFYRVGEACRWAEQRFGLGATAPRDRTANKRPTRAESEKAAREKRPEPARSRLRREVRAAAATAASPGGFLEQLQAAGLLVKPRFSDRNPGEITGYAVALPGDHDASGRPVWFGGAKLAADLSWTKLAHRWGAEAATRPPAGKYARPDRAAAWDRARRAAVAGAAEVRHLAATNPSAAADVAHAAADVLYVAARVAEGRSGGPITDAATAYERASRELWGRTPPRTHTGEGLRSAARVLALTGRTSRDETTQLLYLLTALAALAEAVAVLRDLQHRSAQATAARETADRLRAVAPDRPAVVALAGRRRPEPLRNDRPPAYATRRRR